MRIQWKALILCLILTPAIIGVARWAQSREAEGGMMDSEGGEPGEGGLRFRLGEGQASTFEPRRIEPAAAAPLPDADAQKVLSRLQPIAAESSDQQEFALRPSSLPPPLTGAPWGKWPYQHCAPPSNSTSTPLG